MGPTFAASLRRRKLRVGNSCKRVAQGCLALFCFIASTLVLPAAHIYNHWDDHIHTANGVLFVDGRVEPEEAAASLNAVLNEIREAAFGKNTAPNEAAAAASRFSGSAGCSRGGPTPTETAAHGDGSLLHFALLFQAAVPTLHAVQVLEHLCVIAQADTFVSPSRVHTRAPHIRGPPSRA